LVKRTLDAFEHVDLVGYALAVRASEHYRSLRDRGVTVRKTIDTLIATFCIENDMALLHADRDFDPFVQHLGLKVAHSAA
jgi:predicted nucleic acid-binding protein